MRDKPHSVYRFFDADGQPLYVGCTDCLPARMREHQLTQPWWHEVATVEVTHHSGRKAGLTVEWAEIQRLHPQHTGGHRRYEGADAACAFDRFCGSAATHEVSILQTAGHWRTYPVCGHHYGTRMSRGVGRDMVAHRAFGEERWRLVLPWHLYEEAAAA